MKIAHKLILALLLGALMIWAVGVFIEQTPAQLHGLRAAMEGRDMGAARRTAHSIKGTAASIGATTVSEQAGQIELALKNTDLETAGRLFPKLRKELGRLEEYLSAFEWGTITETAGMRRDPRPGHVS